MIVVYGNLLQLVDTLLLGAGEHALSARLGCFGPSGVTATLRARLAGSEDDLDTATRESLVDPAVVSLEFTLADTEVVEVYLSTSQEKTGSASYEALQSGGAGGTPGPAGPAGPQGPAGPTGPQGIPGSLQVEISGEGPLVGIIGSPTLAGVIDE